MAFLLLIALVLVAAVFSSPTPQESPATVATRHAVLEKIVNEREYDRSNGSTDWVLNKWNVTWHNDTDVTMLAIETMNVTKDVSTITERLIAFPTT